MLATRDTVFESAEQLLTLCSTHLLIPACRVSCVIVIHARGVAIMTSASLAVLGSSPQRPDGGSPSKSFDIEAEKRSLRQFIQGTSATAACLRQRPGGSAKKPGDRKTNVKSDPEAIASAADGDAEGGEEEEQEEEQASDDIAEEPEDAVMRKPAAAKNLEKGKDDVDETKGAVL